MVDFTGAGDLEARQGAVALAQEVMRRNVMHPNPEVRGIVASYLIARGDRAAMTTVLSAERDGQITLDEALNYYQAAPPMIGNPELRRIAETADVHLAAMAVSTRAADTTQQGYVRDRFLRNVGANQYLRSHALAGLAQFDTSFRSYADEPVVADFARTVLVVPGLDVSGQELVANAMNR